MLPFQLRLILVLGTLCALWIMCSKMRHSKLLIEDAVFWIVAAGILVLLSILPGIALNLSNLLGFLSPANFIYLVVIALLLWKSFTSSGEISLLKARVNELAQELALAKKVDSEKTSDSEKSNEK